MMEAAVLRDEPAPEVNLLGDVMLLDVIDQQHAAHRTAAVERHLDVIQIDVVATIKREIALIVQLIIEAGAALVVRDEGTV